MSLIKTVRPPIQLVSLLLLPALALAQEVPQKTLNPPRPASNDPEIVPMEAFNVTGAAMHGYAPSETGYGTRIASKLLEVPFNVNVVTGDFLKDFGAYDLNEQLAFVSSFSPSEMAGQFQLRGFPQPMVLVDGFRRVGLVDTSNIERIEVIKGPAASIYGITLPGGIVNFLTPQPGTEPRQEVTVAGGGRGFLRSTLSTGGSLGSSRKFSYRVDAAYQMTRYGQQFASREKSVVAGKLRYTPSADTDVTFSFEHSELNEHPLSQVLTIIENRPSPWAGNDVPVQQFLGLALKDLGDYNSGGPNSFIRQRVTSGALALRHRMGRVWSLRLGANVFVNPYHDQLVGSGAYYPYGTGDLTVVNGVVQQPLAPVVKSAPQADWKPQRGGGLQIENLFTFATGPVSHKLLLAADYYELAQRTVSLYPTVNGERAVDYYALNSPRASAGASGYRPAPTWKPGLGYGWNSLTYAQNPALYDGIQVDQWIKFADYGAFASERASFFRDRLTLLVGTRRDYVRNRAKNYNVAQRSAPGAGAGGSAGGGGSGGGAGGPGGGGGGPGGDDGSGGGGGGTGGGGIGGGEPANFQRAFYNVSAWTYQAGFSYKVVSGLNLYANKSTAFNPQLQIDPLTGTALPNNTSNGVEFGIKTSLLGGRLNFTAAHFQINHFNVWESEVDSVSNNLEIRLIGQETAKGYEFDSIYQVTDSWLVGANLGSVKTSIGLAKGGDASIGFTPFLLAAPARRVPRNNLGLYTKYTFDHGALRGLYLTAGSKYYSKSLVDFGTGAFLTPGPAGANPGEKGAMWYVPRTNLTYTGADPGIPGEVRYESEPVINKPFPGLGLSPYPKMPANAVITTPMDSSGLPLASNGEPGVYRGRPTGIVVEDGRDGIFNASYVVFEVGAGYTWKKDRFTHRLQMNVSNLLNRKYTFGSGMPGMPFQIISTYTLKF